MILESVYLQVKAGQAQAFITAFREASEIIAGIEGYISHDLHQSLEDDHLFLLLVQWETLEAHTITFRESEDYQRWKDLLHHFYDPFPTVWHFKQIELEQNTS